MTERTWIVEYSIKRKAGYIEEIRTKVIADTIDQAIEMVNVKIIEHWKKDPSIADVRIWDVGLRMGEPVF